MEDAKMQRTQTVQAQREADERWGRPLAPDPAGQSWKVTGLDVGYQVRGFLLYTYAEFYTLNLKTSRRGKHHRQDVFFQILSSKVSF